MSTKTSVTQAAHKTKVKPVRADAISNRTHPRRYIHWLVAGLIALIPGYAFLTVWASTAVGHYTLLRLWPECITLIIIMWLLWKHRFVAVWQDLQRARLAWPIGLFAGLVVLYYALALIAGNVGFRAAGYGLLVDIRPVVWFVTVYAVARQSNWLYRHWQPLTLVPLALVAIFALLQFFVLPPDFLTHFGYVKDSTITPIQTINQDTATIRAQSFLRGPNPLGAYVLLGLGLVYVSSLARRYKLLLGGLILAAMVLSFSRSAWIGVIIAGIAWVGVTKGFVRDRRGVLLAMIALLVCIVGTVVMLQSNQGFKNAILHVNDRSTAPQTSNEDRIEALTSGARDVLHEPLGRGLGTAGPASIYNQEGVSRNSENYFLMLGQELGWFGLGLFIVLSYRIAMLLYRQKDRLARMLFATLAGLTFVNLMSYAWADVTLTYLWWGLAGIVLASARLGPLSETRATR